MFLTLGFDKINDCIRDCFFNNGSYFINNELFLLRI